MVEIIASGDIFEIDGVTSYAHGCNCVGAMGKGIALQFRNKFPEMYRQYKLKCKNNEFNPGDVYDYDYGNGHIYNLATEKSWRTGARIQYIEDALTKMFQLAEIDNVKSIAMPTIGAGLGGLNWDIVKEAITKIATLYPNVELYIVENYSKATICETKK